MRAFVSLLLLAAAAAAAPGGEAPSPLVTAVEAYVRDAEMRGFETAAPFVRAPAAGGAVGWLHLRVSYWYPSIDGEIASGGDRLDFRDDLGLDDNEGTVVPEVLLSIGSLGVRFDAFFLEFDGQSTITRPFTFGGVVFLVNEDVTSHVEINHLRLLGTFPVVRSDFLELRVQGGLQVFDIDGTVEGSTSGTSRASGTIPIPVVGVLAQIKVSRILLELDVAGLSIEYGDVEGTVLDARASVGVTVLKIVAVRAGYRVVFFDGSADDVTLDATLEGFFVGASISF